MSFGGLPAVSHAIRYPSDFVGFVFLDGMTPWDIAAGGGDFSSGAEPVDLRAELAELQSAQFGSRPVLALIAEYPEGGKQLVRRSSNRMLATAGVGHFIFRDAPQLAVAAIRLVVTSVRTGAMLPACEQTSFPGLGGSCESVG